MYLEKYSEREIPTVVKESLDSFNCYFMILVSLYYYLNSSSLNDTY